MNLILLITIFFQTVTAQPNIYSQLHAQEKRDYDFVTKSCHADSDTMAAMVESAKNDTMEDLRYFFTAGESFIPQDGNLVTRKGLGKHTARLLNSNGYLYGLKACFPKDEAARHRYTIKLLMLDAYGKVIAISAIGILGASIYKSLAFLGRRLAVEPTVSIFRRLNASDKFLAKIPNVMRTTGIVSFNALALGSLAHHVYQEKKNRELLEKIYADPDIKELHAALEENLNLYHQAIELKSKAKTAEQEAIANNLIKEQRTTVLFYVDTIETSEFTTPQEKINLQELESELKKN